MAATVELSNMLRLCYWRNIVYLSSAAGPSTARPKRRKLPATAEVDLLLPIVKESVDNVL